MIGNMFNTTHQQRCSDMAMSIYNINLLQKMTGEYVIMIYKQSKKIGEMAVGNDIEEARQNANDIAEAFKHAGINDQTD